MIGKRFTELLSVDSTNNYAMRLLQNGEAKHGDAWFAHEQSEGRGQQNKKWFSNKGENIILSIFLNTILFKLSQQFILNMITALSVVDLFNEYTTEIKIKWPNDIYIRDRKTAGILIENSIRGSTWQYAVLGIGANINQISFPDDLKNPTSLKQVTGNNYNAIHLAKKLCILLDDNLTKMNEGNGQEIIHAYNNVLYMRNQTVVFKAYGKTFSATVKRVDANGNLVIDNGTEIAFRSGEIEWLL